MRDTRPLLKAIPFPALQRNGLDTLQVNVGYRCNQSCVHCHVAAGPHRTEQMGAEVIRFDQICGGPDSARWPLGPHGQSLYWEGLNKGKKSLAIAVTLQPVERTLTDAEIDRLA